MVILNMVILNPHLLKQQRITPLEESKILKLHDCLEEVRVKMRNTQDKTELKAFAVEVEELEFKLQDAWKFKRDQKRHSHWYTVPHCLCPNLDNAENWGTKYRIIHQGCPVHGR